MVAAKAMRRMHSPDDGIHWLLVKPWMRFIRGCVPQHTTASDLHVFFVIVNSVDTNNLR